MATNPTAGEVEDLIRLVRRAFLAKQLTSICHLNGLRAQGVKGDVQNRIVEYIKANAHNPSQFASIKTSIYQVHRAGKHAPVTPAPSNARRSNWFWQPPASSEVCQPQCPTPSSLNFTKSPFYSIEKTLRVVPLPENRSSAIFALKATDSASISQCIGGSDFRIMVFGAANPTGVQDIFFPTGTDLRVNDGPVKARFAGLKGKPGSTLPVDITPFLRLSPSSFENIIRIGFPLCSKRNYVAVTVCRVYGVEEIVRQLEFSRRIPKESTLDDLRTRASDADVVATSQKLSLKCPLSIMKLKTPCRSIHCKHLQCFDASSYLQLQEQGPQWVCPICNTSARYDSLAVDMYVKEICTNTNEDVEQVTIEPTGEWHLNTETQLALVNSMSRNSTSTSSNDCAIVLDGDASASRHTPSLSLVPPSRCDPDVGGVAMESANDRKRKAPEVIDLTLDSSDEDEPQAKRVRTDPTALAMRPSPKRVESPARDLNE